MNPFLLEQVSSRASTAIVVGRVGERVLPRSDYRSALWFVDAAGAALPPPGLGPSALDAVVLEHTAPAQLKTLLERFTLRDGLELPDILVTSDVAERNTEGYELVVGAMHDVLESLRRIRATRQEEGFLWQKHLLLNLPGFIRRRVPAGWENALAGLPAIVCGAGPSLDVSAAPLARFADGAVVFSADSALRTLARHGVQADFAVSVDAGKPPEKCIPRDLEPGRVVLAAISPPAWMDLASDFRLHFLSGRNLTEQLLEARGVARTGVAVEENCGITAFALARWMGCAPIHLFGMDLAADATDPARRHARDSDPSIGRGSGFEGQQDMPLVEGNYSPEVPTFLYGELRRFNELLQTLPSGLVRNVSDRGARLANTELVHPDSFDVRMQAVQKRPRLSELSAPIVRDAAAARAALAEIGTQGAHGCREIARLRGHLEAGNCAAFVADLGRVFAHGEFGRVMGAFSLKAMPHLTSGARGDVAFYTALADELEELCCLAEGLYDTPLS